MKDLQSELKAQRDHKLYRSRLVSQSAQSPECVINGRGLLSFCSNDYLGLANHAAVNMAFRKGIDQWGTGSGAAHLINGHSAAHHALEEELAEFTGRERALLFSTGYMANLAVASALLERNDQVIADKLSHASLIDAALLSGAKFTRYQHANLEHLAQKLDSGDPHQTLVLTDSVFSMDGDIAPLDKLSSLCLKNRCWLMVDEAHALGVYPFQGRHAGCGAAAASNLSNQDVPILMGTLGKAFGTFGAFIAGDNDLIETLIQSARTYIYTTALPSALAEATRASLQIVRSEQWRRDHLQDTIAQFKRFAKQLDLPLIPSDTPIQPLLVETPERAVQISRHLFDQGILVSAIRPPTVPKNTARLRITFSAAHSEKHLQLLLIALEKAFGVVKA